MVLLVGRGPEAHLRLYSDRVSPRHAWVRRDARGTWVSDAGSRTGTLVNGEALTPRQARLLRDGDRVTFGPITTVYRGTAAADEDEPPVFAKVVRVPGTGRGALVLGPVLVVAGFGLGASRLLRYFAAGPEVGLGGTLLTAGVVVTVLGLVLANRPQWK